MANIKTLKPIKSETKKYHCLECDTEKRQTEFYKSYVNKSGLTAICKECFFNACVDEDGKINKEKTINALMKIDKPYLENLFIQNANKYETAKGILGMYIKDISLPQNRTLTFKDSMYEGVNERKEITSNNISNEYKYELTPDDRITLLNKWGDFSDDELIKFERKYQTMSKSYQILSQMHEESLINVCRLEVFYATALKEKNASEIKLFGDLLSKAKQEAKLNPNQLSKNDLSSTGANSFGEIVRLVSKRDGICKLPLKYLHEPNDKIDYAIYQFIAYERALHGLPEIKYEDIYKWYIDDIKKYEERTGNKFYYDPKYIK